MRRLHLLICNCAHRTARRTALFCSSTRTQPTHCSSYCHFLFNCPSKSWSIEMAIKKKRRNDNPWSTCRRLEKRKKKEFLVCWGAFSGVFITSATKRRRRRMCTGVWCNKSGGGGGPQREREWEQVKKNYSIPCDARPRPSPSVGNSR